jgi:hypothetical protein
LNGWIRTLHPFLYYTRCSFRYGLRCKLPVANNFRLVLPSRALGARVTSGILAELFLSSTLSNRLPFMVSGISGTFRHRINTASQDEDTSLRRSQRQHICSQTSRFTFLCSVLSPRSVTLGFSVGYQIVHIYPCSPFLGGHSFGISLGFTFGIPGSPDGSQFSFLFLDMYILLEWRLCIMENLRFGQG